MQLTVTGKQLDIGDALKSHIEDHLVTIVSKYFEKPLDSSVTMTKEGATFRTDIQVHISKRVMVQGLGKAHDAYAAFDEALEHVAKRLRRNKRRLRDHKQIADRESHQAQYYVVAPEPDDANDAPETGDQPVIVAELPTEIATMSVGEAVMQMDLSGSPALMFRNTKDGGLNMVYVREDGNIGWVDPQITETPKS